MEQNSERPSFVWTISYYAANYLLFFWICKPLQRKLVICQFSTQSYEMQRREIGNQIYARFLRNANLRQHILFIIILPFSTNSLEKQRRATFTMASLHATIDEEWLSFFFFFIQKWKRIPCHDDEPPWIIDQHAVQLEKACRK